MIGINLSSKIINEVNEILPWHTKTCILDDIILGKTQSQNKRNYLEKIPDDRITKLNDLLDLSDKKILEIGCLEGSHTLGLLKYAKDVVSIDCRPVNVIKTLTRLSFHGKSAGVFCFNADDLTIDNYGFYDVIFHCGVLYHLKDPVSHLQNIFKMCNYIFLDTHVTNKENKIMPENNWSAPFAGKDDTALWLSIDNLEELCEENGFIIEKLEKRNERNGLRVSWLLSKEG